eukprot:2144520-Rhodomonas_salina.1
MGEVSTSHSVSSLSAPGSPAWALTHTIRVSVPALAWRAWMAARMRSGWTSSSSLGCRSPLFHL